MLKLKIFMPLEILRGLLFIAVLLTLCPSVIHAEILAVPVYEPEPELRIGVLEFQSGTLDVTIEQARIVGNNFTQRLAEIMNDRAIIVGYGQLKSIAEKNGLSTEGYIPDEDAAKIGRLAGCRYIITGMVTDFKTRGKSSKIGIIITFGNSKDTAYSAADIRLIDTETGGLMLATSDITSLSTTESVSASQSISSISMSLAKSGGAGINRSEAAAMFIMSTKLALSVNYAIHGEMPEIISVSNKEVKINAGLKAGFRKGLMYRIYTEEGGKEQNIAIVKVNDADDRSSTAVIYGKNGYGKLSLVRVGDRVFPTDATEMKTVIKKKQLMKERKDLTQ